MCDALNTTYACTPVTAEEESTFRRIIAVYKRFIKQDHRRHLPDTLPRLIVMPGHSAKRNVGISGYTMAMLDTDPVLPEIINERLFTGVSCVRLLPPHDLDADELNSSLFLQKSDAFSSAVRELRNIPLQLQLSLDHFPGSELQESKPWECCLDSGASFCGVYAAVRDNDAGYPETQYYAVVRAGCGLVSKQLYTELQRNVNTNNKTDTVKQFFQSDRVSWAAQASVRNRLRILARIAAVFGCEVSVAKDTCAANVCTDDTHHTVLHSMHEHQKQVRYAHARKIPLDPTQRQRAMVNAHAEMVQTALSHATRCLAQLETQDGTKPGVLHTKIQLKREIDDFKDERILMTQSELPLFQCISEESEDDSSDYSSDECNENETIPSDLNDDYAEPNGVSSLASHSSKPYIVSNGCAHDYFVNYASPMPDNARVWTLFNNCTGCHNVQHGVLIAVSPYGGLRWMFGPARDGKGNWRSSHTFHAFPVQTGPLMNGVQIASAYDAAYNDGTLRQMLNKVPSTCKVIWDGCEDEGNTYNHRCWHGAYRTMDTAFKNVCNQLGQRQVWGSTTMVPIVVKVVGSSKNLLPTCII